MRRMDEIELLNLLKSEKLTLNEACSRIYSETTRVIDPRHVRTHIDRYGSASETQAALFELLVLYQRLKRRKDGKTA